MTLQQKMLAKQSKKGFTLVELVVVIAILAILAAIAIPAVIGIINSATTSGGQSDASTLNNACKEFYAGVTSGTINDNNKGKVSTDLPAATASTTERKKAAAALSVKDAQDYSGLAVKVLDMVYVKTTFDKYTVGTILFKDDPALKDHDSDVVKMLNAATEDAAGAVGSEVKFKDLYNLDDDGNEKTD